MESHLAFTTSTACGTTNARRLIRERLESCPLSNHHQGSESQTRPNQRQGSGSHPAATTSSSFTNAFDIPNSTPSPTKISTMGYSLWRGYCCCTGIKDSTFCVRNLCKHTWKVMVCIVLTGKGRLRPGIWPKTRQQLKSTKSMMRTT